GRFPGPGAPGGGVEVPGCGDAGAAFGRGPGDAEPVTGAAAGFELPVLDPVVDDAGAAAELPGRAGHGDLAGGGGGRDRDLVDAPDPLDGLDVEGAACAGAVSVPGEDGDEVVVAGGRAEAADQLGGRGRRGGRDSARAGPGDDELVRGPGVPADPDPGLGPVGLGQQRDVSDQGAQQPLAVTGGGGRG